MMGVDSGRWWEGDRKTRVVHIASSSRYQDRYESAIPPRTSLCLVYGNVGDRRSIDLVELTGSQACF